MKWALGLVALIFVLPASIWSNSGQTRANSGSPGSNPLGGELFSTSLTSAHTWVDRDRLVSFGMVRGGMTSSGSPSLLIASSGSPLYRMAQGASQAPKARLFTTDRSLSASSALVNVPEPGTLGLLGTGLLGIASLIRRKLKKPTVS